MKQTISSIQSEISKLKNVSKVEVSSKDDELELMIKEKGDAFKAYRGETNPLSNAFFVYVKNASSIRKTSVQIQKIDGVSKDGFWRRRRYKLSRHVEYDSKDWFRHCCFIDSIVFIFDL